MPIAERIAKLLSRRSIPLALLAVLACAAALRLYGLNWDGAFGAHPHPDERHLANTMSRISLPWPPDWRRLADPDRSPLNPRRLSPEGYHYDLAYGTLPIYIYRAVAAFLRECGAPWFDTYDGFYVVGRAVTVAFALITVLLAYATGAALYGPWAGVLGALLLALSVTHIQLSHFMTVDLALTMFIAGGLYWGLRFAREGGGRNALRLGLSLGGAMACKISGLTLAAAVAAAYLLWALRRPDQGRAPLWRRGIGYAALTLLGTLLLFGTFEFYALLDPGTYIQALRSQSEMVNGANDWPFTRQYVHTTPYLYHLDNLLRWGLGWPLGLAALAGVLFACARIVRSALPALRRGPEPRWGRFAQHFLDSPPAWGSLLLLSWALPYFAFIGRYEVKFVRYMLPLVPVLCVLAGWFLLALAKQAGRLGAWLAGTRWAAQHLAAAEGGPRAERLSRLAYAAVILLVAGPTLIWALAFLRIYARPHTWHDASRWLYANAPRGATVSAESWDDALPVDLPREGRTRDYFAPNVTFEIYHDMPPEAKFQHLVGNMRRADFIVLATPRLYGAIRRLPWRYPVEIRYYELLFEEKLGFELAYSAMSYPSIWGLTFVDDAADESFSVYDHPKVLIYRKTRDLPEEELRGLFAEALQATPLVTRLGSDPPVELPVPRYRKPLMLEVPVDALPAVGDYAWNRWASSHAALSVLVWLVAFLLVSWAALPLSAALFGDLADGGYLLAKPLGLLLLAYFAWLPASLGLWHYTLGGLLLALAGVAALSRWAARGQSALHLWRRHRRRYLLAEGIFLGAFLLGLLLRLGNPDLWHPVNGGEKPMEFGFLNAILRSPTMPPYDPFFSGGYINYYYYGLFIVSTLIKLTGLLPSVGFNLAIATLFALTISGAYVIVATLAGRKAWGLVGGALVALIGPLSGAVPVRGRGGFGEVIAAMQQLAPPGTQGALARLWQGFWRWLGPEVLPLRTDWFWDASRTHGPYENTITEFPFWSFLFADLHPHTINIPFTILAIAFALRLVRRPGGEQPDAEERGWALPPWAIFLLTCLVLGALSIINSWDFPTFALLCGGSLILGHFLRLGERRPVPRLAEAVLAGGAGAALLIPLSLALYFPFFTHFQAFVKGLGRVTHPTEVNYYLGFFGPFLFLIASYALWRLAQRKPPEANGQEAAEPEVEGEAAPSAATAEPEAEGEAAPSAATEAPRARRRELWRLGIWALPFLVLAATILASRWLYPAADWKQTSTLCLIAQLMLWAAMALCKRGLAWQERFALWLAIVGLAVSLGVEVVYIRDHLGGAWYRMNTIFKFYTHTWVILALAAASALAFLWQARWPQRRGVGMGLWRAAFSLMMAAACLYPLFATQSRWRDRFPAPPPWGTLDGLAYMRTATYVTEGHQIFLQPDYEAIRWLIENIQGTPVILQAPYGFYRENGVRIAANTGFPTVLNPLHENEQRYDELIGPRHQDAQRIYETPDAEEALRLLGKYGVSYVYIGPFERAFYPPAGIAKFDALIGQQLELVYDRDEVRIYRLSQSARRAYGGYAGAEVGAVAVPTVEPRPSPALDRDALRNLERAAEAAPDNPGLQFELGERYRQLGRLEDAVRVFQRSLKYHPEDVAMHHTLGDTYAMMGQPEKALAQYIEATRVAPTNPAAFNKLGMAYLERDQAEEAVRAFQKAVENDPRFAESFFHLGEAYEKLGRREEARAAYEQAREVGPGSDWEKRAVERLRALGQ